MGMTSIGIILMVLGGALKALRDRDDFTYGVDPSDSDYSWLHGFEWYKKWHDTDAYFLSMPLDAWHTFDELLMLTFTMGGGFLWPTYGYTTLLFVIFVAWTSKTVFYHVILMKRPLAEIREYLSDMRKANSWLK